MPGCDVGPGLLTGLVMMALALGCGGAPPPAPPAASRAAVEPDQPAPVPAAEEVRQRALSRLGRRLYAALAEAAPSRILFDDVALRRLLEPESATRVAALRVGLGARLALRPGAFAVLREAQFAGLCIQGARLEPKDTPLGLRADGWIFDRALVVGHQPGGRRTAAWVEGTFLYTNAGFGAIDLVRVEEPRWEHSDLELATCDMEVGLDTPLPVVHATP